MRSRISIRGCVRPSVGPSVRPSVRPSVGPSVGHTRVKTMHKCRFWPKLLSVRARTHLMPCIRLSHTDQQTDGTTSCRDLTGHPICSYVDSYISRVRLGSGKDPKTAWKTQTKQMRHQQIDRQTDWWTNQLTTWLVDWLSEIESRMYATKYDSPLLKYTNGRSKNVKNC